MRSLIYITIPILTLPTLYALALANLGALPNIPDTKWTLVKADPFPNAPIALPISPSNLAPRNNIISSFIPPCNPTLRPTHNLTSPRLSKTSKRKRVTIGPTEDRHLLQPNPPLQPLQYPYTTIGRLISTRPGPNGSAYQTQCSGSLIGPRHVATAAHCIHPEYPLMTYRFQPSYHNGESSTLTPSGSFAIKYYRGEIDLSDHIPTQPQTPPPPSPQSQEAQPKRKRTRAKEEEEENCKKWQDYAILILADRLGDTVGSVGVGKIEYGTLRIGSAEGEGFSVFGYPGDLFDGEMATRQDGVRVVRKVPCQGPLWTDADASGGMSGGPIWRAEGAGRGAGSGSKRKENGKREGKGESEGGDVYQYGVLSEGLRINGEWFTSFSAGVGFLTLANLARREFP